MPSSAPRANVSVAIQRVDDGSILVLSGGTPPYFDIDVTAPWQEVASVFAREIAVTGRLADRDPGLVPARLNGFPRTLEGRRSVAAR